MKTHAGDPNATVDYDADNDGLIEVDSLLKLNAIRYDLDGDGAGDKYDSNDDGDYTDTGEYDYTTQYATAFPNAEDNMGCNESVFTIASNNTGNPVCSGYELTANLDFDTNSSGGANAGDTYWNSGAGLGPHRRRERQRVHGRLRRQQRHGRERGRRAVHDKQPVHRQDNGQLRRAVRVPERRVRHESAGRRAGERGRYVQHDGLRLQHGRLHGRAGRARRRRRDDRGQLRHRAGAGRRVGHRAGHHQRQHRELVRRRAGGPPGRRRSVELLARGRDGIHQGNHA